MRSPSRSPDTRLSPLQIRSIRAGGPIGSIAQYFTLKRQRAGKGGLVGHLKGNVDVTIGGEKKRHLVQPPPDRELLDKHLGRRTGVPGGPR